MTHDHQAVRLNRGELWTWMAIALALAALYPPTVLGGLAAIGAATVVAWINPRISIDGRATAAFVAVASWPVFFSWRTNLLNADGTMLTPKFQRDVPLLGAHLTHDELLELFLHSRVWYYTSRWRGWSVVFSYQMVSCIAGCVFIYALVRLSRRLAPERTWLFLLGMLSGGYMQLFFGDVENYTVTAAIVMLYVLAAWRYIAREAPLWAPILGLAIAMCFHLETAWLLPSAVYLCTLSRSRTASLRETWSSTALGAATIAAVFVYFHFHGLPLRRFFSSHAGNALRANGVFAIGMPSSYYVDQLKLIVLLCPAIVMVVPAVLWRQRTADEGTRFLAICAASMLSLQVVWKSQIGVFDDWNLYAIGGMLTAMFIWRYAAAAAVTRSMRITAAAVAAIGSLHTYAWIIANHRHGQ